MGKSEEDVHFRVIYNYKKLETISINGRHVKEIIVLIYIW